MKKRVLDVGNCVPDHSTITRYLAKHFDCEVLQADRASDALETLRRQPVDLIVVNRKLDVDYSDGMDVIRQIKADPALAETPVMLLTNYPEHQEAAMAIGAVRGFGKLEYGDPATLERLRPILGE